MKDDFKNLLEHYKEIADKEGEKRKEVEDLLAKSEQELSEVQKRLETPATMSFADYQNASQRNEKLMETIEYYTRFYDNLKNGSPLTQEEAFDLRSKITGLMKTADAEVTTLLCEKLTALIDVAEEYTTQLNALHTLEFYVSGTVGKPYGMAAIPYIPSLLPPVLSQVNALLLTAYNDYAKQRENGKLAVGYKRQELEKIRSELFSKSANAFGFQGLPDVTV